MRNEIEVVQLELQAAYFARHAEKFAKDVKLLRQTDGLYATVLSVSAATRQLAQLHKDAANMSRDFRNAAITRLREQGYNVKQVADIFGVSHQRICNIISRTRKIHDKES